jgi:hypothetical protein
MLLQALLRLLPIAEVGVHKAFPKAAVIGNLDVQQFMHDHEIPEVRIERQEIETEGKAAVAGAGGPFAAHRAERKGGDGNIKLLGSVMHPSFEDKRGRRCLPDAWDLMGSALAKRVNNLSNSGITCPTMSHSATRAKVTFWRISRRAVSLARQLGMITLSKNSEQFRARSSGVAATKAAAPFGLRARNYHLVCRPRNSS